MTPQIQPDQRVSVLARILPALPCWVLMLGAALSAILIMGVMNGMRNAETAGIGAVATGVAQANLSIVLSLYLAILLMTISIIVAVVRMFTANKTAAPSVWFFAIAELLAIVPLALAWKADSLLVGALIARANVALIASNVQLCLTLALVTAGLFSLILLVVSVIPLPSILRARQSWPPVVMLALMEISLIALAIAFQLHMSGLQRVGMRESF